jgi:hypothetical protein
LPPAADKTGRIKHHRDQSRRSGAKQEVSRMSSKNKLVNIVATLAVMTAFGCSSSQQDEENLEVNDQQQDGQEEGQEGQAGDEGQAAAQGTNQQGDLGNDDAAEGNGQENYVDGENANEAENGAETNSEVTDDTAEEAFPVNNMDNMTASNNVPVETVPTNAPMNNIGMATNASMPAAEPAPMAAAAAPQSDVAPIPGGRVRYVPAGGVQVLSAPGGGAVATLEQGDHPVTWEENGYLKIGNGMYVPVGSMSDAGVARPFNARVWQGGK